MRRMLLWVVLKPGGEITSSFLELNNANVDSS